MSLPSQSLASAEHQVGKRSRSPHGVIQPFLAPSGKHDYSWLQESLDRTLKFKLAVGQIMKGGGPDGVHSGHA